MRALARISSGLAPFMPDKASEIWSRLGGDGAPPPFDALVAAWPKQVPESTAGVLFPRIEKPRG